MQTGIIAGLKIIAPLLLYAAWVFLCLFSLSGRVKSGIMFIVALMPLQNVVQKLQVFPLGKDLIDILIICVFFGSIIAASQSKRRFMESTSLNGLLILTIIYTYFTLWNGSFFLGAPPPISPLDGRVQNWKNYIVFFMIFWMVFNNMRTTKDVRQLFWVMVAVMCLMNYYTVDQIKYSSGLASREKFNGTFFWLGVNEVAAFYAAYTFVIWSVFLLIKQKIPKIILGVLGAFNTYVLLFLFSRGAYAAFFIGAFVFSFLRKKWLLIPLIIIAISWKTLLPMEVVQRIEHTQTEQGELDGSSARRIVMWEQSLQLFKHSPIIGSGFNIFPYLGFELGDTHNVFIKFLAEQGIIGLILLFMVLIFAFRSGWKLYRRSNDTFFKGLGLGFVVCIVSLFVANMFGDRWTYLQVGTFFWVFLAMVERGNVITAEAANELASKRVDELKPKKADEVKEIVQKSKFKAWQIKKRLT